MRVKSLTEPTGILNEGDEWLSPDGHSSTWRRVWNGTTWDVELNSTQHPEPTDKDELEEPEIDPESLEEIEIEVEDDPLSTEDPKNEQRDETAISDRHRGEQGAGGKSEPKQQQRGKRGKVRKGGKGK